MRSAGLKRFTVGIILLALAACGDDAADDDSDAGMDAGPMDSGASTEAGSDTGTMEDAGPDGAPACDPFDVNTCGSDAKCSLVWVFEDTDAGSGQLVDLYFGCVGDPSTPRLGVQAPCALFPLDATPENPDDDHVADNCEDGLVCLNVGGVARCRPMCSGTLVDCGSGNLCDVVNEDPTFGICQAADDCDVVLQTGCGSDEGCYVRSTTSGELIGDCAPFVPPEGGTGTLGDSCQFINNCWPGSMCSAEQLSDGGLGSSICQRLCATDPGMIGGGDAGMGGEDAGAPEPADCDTATVCADYCAAFDTCFNAGAEPGEEEICVCPLGAGCHPESSVDCIEAATAAACDDLLDEVEACEPLTPTGGCPTAETCDSLVDPENEITELYPTLAGLCLEP